eukprot:INCI4442.1.p1 GENE.INCI4442.1~~INCI4442.1.p1  ORF type:complete len:168 (-),score=25.81 INCI4442.1:128-631(-)
MKEEDIPEGFRGHTHGYSGLGLYSTAAENEEHFRRIEVDFNCRAARCMKAGGVHSFSYLSGQGVTQSPSWYTPMFARVKGAAETVLLHEVGFRRATSVRPPAIFDRGVEGDEARQDFMNRWLRFLLRTRFGVTAEQIATAMVASTTDDTVAGPEILEAADIVAAAKP